MYRTHPSQMTPEQIEAARYKPANAVRMTIKGTNAIAYTAPHSKYPEGAVVLVYVGKAIKPLSHYGFRTRESAAKHISDTAASLLATAQYKDKRKTERNKANTLAVGDVLYSSWGYDQTNIDFYQVTKAGARCVWARPIGQSRESTGWETGNCVPVPDSFHGEEKRYVVQYGNSFRVASYASATLAEFSIVAGVKVYESHRWSSYA